MKKKLLCCALLAGMSMAQSVMAQDYDDRFYVTAGAGVGFFDEDRDASDDLYGMIGFGRFITPNISVDAELWHSNPDLILAQHSQEPVHQQTSKMLGGKIGLGQFVSLGWTSS